MASDIALRPADDGNPGMATFAAATFAIFLSATSSLARDGFVDDDVLRIASWNLTDAAGAGVISRPKRNEKRWRNTFGAELKTRTRVSFPGRRLKADVILLQGVSSIREARQIFPARDWKLIVSRQILQFGGGRINEDSELQGRRTTTAVAVRYQRQLRVTGLEHLLDLASPDGGKPGDTVTGAAASATGAMAPGGGAAGLAVRLAFSGSVLWVVSADLPEVCRETAKTCEEAKRLVAWANIKRVQGFKVAVGGKLNQDVRKKGTASLCAGQELVADQSLEAEVGADTIAGCVAFADIEAAEISGRPN